MVGGVLPLPGASERWISTMPKIVSKQAADNPILFYKHFLENTVLTHPETFAHLTALGETITGIGLTLGLLTGVASLVGLVLVTNYGLATQWMSPGQQGFHIVLFALMIAFFAARAGPHVGVSTRCCGARGPNRSSRGVHSPDGGVVRAAGVQRRATVLTSPSPAATASRPPRRPPRSAHPARCRPRRTRRPHATARTTAA